MTLAHGLCRARLFPLACLAALGAAACSTVPPAPPPAAAPRPPAGQSWEVSPSDGYTDRFGYVRLEFLPPGPPGIPPGGRLVVHLGRQSLHLANTVWFRFKVTEGGSALLDVAGEEGIPNIKGPDGNWWNDVSLDLPKPISNQVRVTADDRGTGMTYTFTVVGR
jgi:hypothetical protein